MPPYLRQRRRPALSGARRAARQGRGTCSAGVLVQLARAAVAGGRAGAGVPGSARRAALVEGRPLTPPAAPQSAPPRGARWARAPARGLAAGRQGRRAPACAASGAGGRGGAGAGAPRGAKGARARPAGGVPGGWAAGAPPPGPCSGRRGAGAGQWDRDVTDLVPAAALHVGCGRAARRPQRRGSAAQHHYCCGVDSRRCRGLRALGAGPAQRGDTCRFVYLAGGLRERPKQ
jgi:hypothetical protein